MKYYIQVNKKGTPLEGGVVSKKKPTYGLYQAIDSQCCVNTTINNFEDDDGVYTPPGPLAGDSIYVEIIYIRPNETSSSYVWSQQNFFGLTAPRTEFTLSEFVSKLNNYFGFIGHWEQDATTGVKLVESPFFNIQIINISVYFD